MPYFKPQVAAMRSPCERNVAEKRERAPSDPVSHSAGSAMSSTALSFFAPEPPLLQFSRKRKRCYDDDEDERHQDGIFNESPAGERPTKFLRAGSPDHSVPLASGYTAGALDQVVARSTSETHRRRRSASRERIMEKLNLLGPLNANHGDNFPPAELPNDIMDEIFTHLDSVDKACFALTSRSNYALVKAAMHMIPRHLCPHQRKSCYPCDLSMKGHSEYRALLRRLALFIPTQDMVYCLTRGGRRYRLKWELEVRDKPWKKKFFKDLRQARMDVVVRLRRMVKADGTRKTGLKKRFSGRSVVAKEEKEWETVITKGRQLNRGGRILRPQLKE